MPKNKYGKIFIEVQPGDLNHTALMRAAEKTGNLKGNFEKIYYTPPCREKTANRNTKGLSREFDQVVDIACKALGFSTSFHEIGKSKTRYVHVCKNVKMGDENIKNSAIKELQDFIKHYRRFENVAYTIKTSEDLPA
jgi:hypothetical protein